MNYLHSLTGFIRISMSASNAKRLPLSSRDLSDQAISAIAVVGIFIWVLLLIFQEHNINTARTYSEARAHARETMISLQAYVLEVRELAVHAEGYQLTDDERYREKYSTALVELDKQARELARMVAELKPAQKANSKLQELVAHEKTLIDAMMQGSPSDDASLDAQQLMLLYKQQEFITAEEKNVVRILREEINQQDANLKDYRQRFYVTKHVIMIYTTLLVLVSLGLVLRERRLRRSLVSIGLTQA